MNILYLVLACAGCWRITHLFSEEDGPFDIFFMIRKKTRDFFWGKLLSCFYCCSVWVALPLAVWIGTDWKEKLLCWMALSGAACLLERATGKKDNSHHHVPEYKED